MNAFHLPDTWVHRTIRVVVIGCGGTGCEVVDALARLELSLKALGRENPFDVRLCDGDEVSASNIGRQRFGMRDLGKNKAVVLASRYNAEFGLDWSAYTGYCAAGDIVESAVRAPYTPLLVITAVDRASFRAELGKAASARGKKYSNHNAHLWLDIGNGSNTGQAILGHLFTWEATLGDRLPNVLNLFPNLPDIPDDDEPSCSLAEALRSQELGINRCVTDPAMFGIIAPLLTKGSVQHHGVFVDMLKARTSPLLIDPSAWDFLAKGNARKAIRRSKPLNKAAQSAKLKPSTTEFTHA